MYEVEMKFRVPSGQTGETLFSALPIQWGEKYEESDCYYRHPARDFAQSDEALRIRTQTKTHTVANNTVQHVQRFITYKGPKIDLETKTRQEIEIPLGLNDPWERVLEELGFRPFFCVKKIRRTGTFELEGRKFQAVVDCLPGLASDPDGNQFIELETLAEDGKEMERARAALLALTQKMSLGDSIRTSYLGLLVAATKQP